LLTVIWRASAREDLRQIISYIAKENSIAARRIKDLLEASIMPAAEHPYMYRMSTRVPGLRKIVAHPNYIVLYRVKETCIEIINVVHARREFPSSS